MVLSNAEKKAVSTVFKSIKSEYEPSVESSEELRIVLEHVADWSTSQPEYRKAIHKAKKQIIKALEAVHSAYDDPKIKGRELNELNFWAENLIKARDLCLIEGNVKSEILGDSLFEPKIINKCYIDDMTREVITHSVNIHGSGGLFMFDLAVIWYRYIDKEVIPMTDDHLFFQLASKLVINSCESCRKTYERNNPQRTSLSQNISLNC